MVALQRSDAAMRIRARARVGGLFGWPSCRHSANIPPYIAKLANMTLSLCSDVACPIIPVFRNMPVGGSPHMQ